MKKVLYTLYRPIAWIINDKISTIMFSITYGQTIEEQIETVKQINQRFEEHLKNRKVANDNENSKIESYLPKIKSMVNDERFNEPIETLTLNNQP